MNIPLDLYLAGQRDYVQGGVLVGQAVQAVRNAISGHVVVVGATFHRRIQIPCQVALRPAMGGDAPLARIELNIDDTPSEVTIEAVPGAVPSLPRGADSKLTAPSAAAGGPRAFRHDGTLGQMLVALAQANKGWIIDQRPLAHDVLFMSVGDCTLSADRRYPEEGVIAVEPISGIRETMGRETVLSRVSVVSGATEAVSAELLFSWKTS